KLDTMEGLLEEFGEDLTGEARSTIVGLARIPAMHQGPYFPLSRYGDYVVTAERDVGTKQFPDYKSANAYYTETRANDPTLSVSFPRKQDGGSYTVSVVEREVRMVETRTEADAARAAMVEKYPGGKVSQPQL